MSGRFGKMALDSNVDAYVTRLESALGDEDRFRSAVAELGGLSTEEVVEISSKFAGYTSKGTPRSKAIDRIKQRQAKLMEFKGSSAGKKAAF